MPRLLRPVVLAGLPVESALYVLAQALGGRGDALLPVPPDDPHGSRRLAALGPGTVLEPAEDEPTDPTAVVVATSGSTGTPKGALLARSALLASATATYERLGGLGTDPGQTWLLALAPHHVAGVQVLVRSLVAGTVPEVLDLAPGFSPTAFVEATQRLRHRAAGQCYTALVPTQLLRLLDAGPDAVAALASYDAVLVGAAATAPALLAQARSAGVRVVTTYGMSETCGGCVYDGRPLTGVTVRLDEDGRVLLAGGVLARGYRLVPDAPQFSTSDGVRWFSTDDLGELANGSLRVVGRADDVIVTGGLKVVPAAVEAVLMDLPDVRECVVVGVEDAEWGQVVVAVVVASERAAPPTLEPLRALVAERLGAAAAPRRLVVLDALPARGPGKADRRAVRAMLDDAAPVR